MLLNPIKTLLGFGLLGFIAAWMGCADSAPVAPHPAGKAHLTLTCPDSTQTNADADGDGLPDSTQTNADADGDGIPDADSTPTYVTFADSSLERAVRKVLNDPTVNPTPHSVDATVPPLTVTDLASLTAFWSHGNNISNIRSLDGLQHATNLQRLNLSGLLFITDVSPLANLPNLTFLRLQGNPLLTNVNPLASLTKLGTLKMHTQWFNGAPSNVCAVSDLSDFGLPGKLPNLKLITVAGCPLSEASETALDTLRARPDSSRVRVN